MQTSSKPWKSASELGYPRRHRADAATGTSSMAWGARIDFPHSQNRRRPPGSTSITTAPSSGIAHTLSTAQAVAKAAWSMPGSSSNLDGDGGGTYESSGAAGQSRPTIKNFRHQSAAIVSRRGPRFEGCGPPSFTRAAPRRRAPSRLALAALLSTNSRLETEQCSAVAQAAYASNANKPLFVFVKAPARHRTADRASSSSSSSSSASSSSS